MEDIYKERTAAGVSVLRASTHRHMQDMDFSCHIPCVKPLLNRHRHKYLSWAKARTTPPNLCSLMEVNLAFPLEIRVPESGGREAQNPHCLLAPV